jgi:hypothetical protein
MAVQLAAVSLDNECLRVATQHFALHRFTPLESAALKIVAEVGRDLAIGGGSMEVAHDREAADAPCVLEKLHLSQLLPLEEVVFAVGELIYGLVRDVAKGALLEIMPAAILFVDLALGVEGRDVGCGRVVRGGRVIRHVGLFRDSVGVGSANVDNRAVVEGELGRVEAPSGAVPRRVDSKVPEL